MDDDENDSVIKITFENGSCIVDADATTDQMRHAIVALAATLIDDAPDTLTDDELETLKAAMRKILAPLQDPVN